MKAYYKVQENIMYFSCHRYQISEDTYSSNKKTVKISSKFKGKTWNREENVLEKKKAQLQVISFLL